MLNNIRLGNAYFYYFYFYARNSKSDLCCLKTDK